MKRPAHAGRQTDENHDEITKKLRSRDAKVQTLAAVGNGCCDLLVGYRGSLAVMEVKPGTAKERHQRELNDNEKKWHREWAGYPVFLILFPEHVDDVIDGFDLCGTWPRIHRTNP